MACDEKLADRVRKAIAKRKGFTQKQMFGGVAVRLNSTMCVGVHANAVIARLDPRESAAALEAAHTRVCDLTGRPMNGWIPSACTTRTCDAAPLMGACPPVRPATSATA
jgi:hypothetical protein